MSGADLGQIAAVEIGSDLSNAGSSCLWGNGHNSPGGQVHQRCAVQYIEHPCYKQIGVLYQPPAACRVCMC